MTQDEFNTMLNIAISQGIGGGKYTSKYTAERIDEILDIIKATSTGGSA